MSFSTPSLTVMLIMDASGTGWGDHLNHLHIQVWFLNDLKLHSNDLELRAIGLACIVLCSYLELYSADPDAQCLCDTLLSTHKKMLLSPHFTRKPSSFWNGTTYTSSSSPRGHHCRLLEQKNGNQSWMVTAEIHPGSDIPEMVYPDQRSVQLRRVPDVKPFASGGQHAHRISARHFFLLEWSQGLFYAFPLILLIPRIISKIRWNKATVKMPFWPRVMAITPTLDVQLISQGNSGEQTKFLPRVVWRFLSKLINHLTSLLSKTLLLSRRKKLHALDTSRALLYYLDRTEPLALLPIFVAISGVSSGPVDLFSSTFQVDYTVHFHLLQALPLNVKSHSTKAQEISSVCFRNMPVAETCKATTWRNSVTFIKHYALDMASRANARFRRPSISIFKSLFDYHNW